MDFSQTELVIWMINMLKDCPHRCDHVSSPRLYSEFRSLSPKTMMTASWILTARLACGQGKHTLATSATDKLKNQPQSWRLLAVWPALVAQIGRRLAAYLTAGGEVNVLVLMLFSCIWLRVFSAEPPPSIPGAGGKAHVSPFILVVETDLVAVGAVPAAYDEGVITRNEWLWRMIPEKKTVLTSGPDQFRLPLHPFAHYDFTVDWGDGTTEVVRSDAPAGQAIVDVAWLAQVKKGLAQPVTVNLGEFSKEEFLFFGESESERRFRYLLKKAGLDLCAKPIVDPQVLTKNAGKMLIPTLKITATTLGDVFEQLKKVTGLTYVLHDRALFITERKDFPRLVCPQHTYAQAGTYQVKITENIVGGFPQIYFNSGYDCVKVVDLAQWGGNTWTSLEAAFRGCANMTISASDAATAVTGAVKEFSQAWSGCRGLTTFPLLNTAAGTNFQDAWKGCAGLTTFPLLNTSAGKCFMGAWRSCHALTSFPLLNTAAGIDFSGAWAACHNLRSFPLLNTAAGTNFRSVWSGCLGLKSFPLLNTAAGINFSGAWADCSNLTNFPLLDTSAGTNFHKAWSYCSGLKNFPLLDASAGSDFSAAWENCRGLNNFPLLNTAAGTNFSGAWRECSGLTSFPLLDTSAGTDFGYAWSNCSDLKKFPLINFAKMEKANECFSGVTLSSPSYGELLDNMAKLNKVIEVDFNGGFSKAYGLIGIQAREKLIKKLGWKIVDGDSPKPAPKMHSQRISSRSQ